MMPAGVRDGNRLAARLGDLVRKRRGLVPAPALGGAGGSGIPLTSPDAAGAGAGLRRVRADLAGHLPGAEMATPRGLLHVHEVVRGPADRGYERLLAKLADARARIAATPAAALGGGFREIQEHGLEGALLLDLETGGLAGNPVFLAGLMTIKSGSIHLRQLLARTYVEEPALVAEVAGAVSAYPLLVTYNGKSFDLPMLLDRACRHRIPFAAPGAHLDLLPHARRAYRGRVPNCRLVTLEWLVCERRRFGDVPGREIPELFHRFARDGDPTAMTAVLHHNALDLVTLAELLAHLVPHPPGPRFVPDEPPLAIFSAA